MREKATTLYLGPQHPGITGNMMVRLKVEGDTIVGATTEVGYLHRAFEKLHAQNRIISYDWNDYSADKVVYQPKNMSAERLQELLQYAWDSFYKNESQQLKMFKLIYKVMQKEKADNTFRPRKRNLVKHSFGKKVAI